MMKKLAGVMLLAALAAAGAILFLKGPWGIFDRMAALAGRHMAENAMDMQGLRL